MAGDEFERSLKRGGCITYDLYARPFTQWRNRDYLRSQAALLTLQVVSRIAAGDAAL